MKILIYGTGAMGSIYAALFKEAGYDVYAVDPWKDHINSINLNGLKIEGASGNRIVKNIKALNIIPKDIFFDLIIVATKASGIEKAALEISKIDQVNNSNVLTIQNGLGSSEKLKNYILEKNILLGVADGFGASIKSPGHVHHNAMKLIRIGEMNSKLTDRLNKIVKIWLNAGFNVKKYKNINQLIWEKFICNVTFSGPCTVYKCSIGELMSNDERWSVAIGCAKEVYNIAKLKKIKLSFEEPVGYVTEFGLKMPNAKPSMLLDHQVKRKSEIDFINGKVAEMGNELNFETPYNFMLSTIIKKNEDDFN